LIQTSGALSGGISTCVQLTCLAIPSFSFPQFVFWVHGGVIYYTYSIHMRVKLCHAMYYVIRQVNSNCIYILKSVFCICACT
jgi:hypothetical protein